MKEREPARLSCLHGCLITGLCLLLVFTVLPWWYRSNGSNRRDTVIPETGSLSTNVGDVVGLGLPGMYGVWLATSDSDWDPMIDAENQAANGGPGDGEALFRMAREGKVRFYAAGTPVVILRRSVFGAYVMIQSTEDKGRGGWIQVDLLQRVAKSPDVSRAADPIFGGPRDLSVDPVRESKPEPVPTERPVQTKTFESPSLNNEITKDKAREKEREAALWWDLHAKEREAEAKKLAVIESRAGTLLASGRNLERAGKAAAARGWYERVVKEFPETKAAAEAKARLKTLGAR